MNDGRFRQDVSLHLPELSGLLAASGAVVPVFLTIGAFKIRLGQTGAAVLYMISAVVMAVFFLYLIRSKRYSRWLWFAESLYFTAWMAAIWFVNGGVEQGMGAAAVVIMCLAVLIGDGTPKVIVIALAAAVPPAMTVIEMIHPEFVNESYDQVLSRLGSGASILGASVLLAVILDRVVAAYSRESDLLRDKAEVLSRLVVIDGLTGLSNHAHVVERLDSEIERVKRYGGPLSVVMIDLDHFKTINDSCGHLEGDRIISRVAGIIRDLTSRTGMAGRYGGEEFLVVLPGFDIQMAVDYAETLRVSVAATAAAGAIPVTVSAGVAQWREGTSHQLLDIADSRLYAAKRMGRNRVTFDDADTSTDQLSESTAVKSQDSGTEKSEHAAVESAS